MEKSRIPTSRYQVFCDLFDVKCEMKIHEADNLQKLQITMQTEDGEKELNLSLYKEDVELMQAFLNQITEHIKNRE